MKRLQYPFPAIALGCMRMAGMEETEIIRLIDTSLSLHINFFDHADIYGKGESERKFGQAIKAAGIRREQLTLQSKCGIDNGKYNASKEHILASVDGSLSRLQTDYLDILLLHRPDALMDPEEIIEAFSTLKQAGKVKYFGVSNHNPAQIALLQSAFDDKLIVNQVQLSLLHTPMLNAGFNVNMVNASSLDHDGGILPYCQMNEIIVQAWSPFQYGFIEGPFIDNPNFPHINNMLKNIAIAHNTNPLAVAAAWLLRLPNQMQVIAGTTNPERLKQIAQACNVHLSRDEWYTLYKAAGNRLP